MTWSDQIRSEFGPSVEFGDGCAGAELERAMVKRIHDNRRAFDNSWRKASEQ